MAKKETSLAKKATPSSIEAAPDYLDKGNQGMEDVRPQDIWLPRLALMQSLSPTVQSSENDAGQLVNNLTGEVWLNAGEELSFIPIKHYLQWIRWGVREKNEGLLEQSLDPKGELAMEAARQVPQEINGKMVYPVTEYHNFIIMCPEIHAEQLAVLSFSKACHKRGRQLIGLIRTRGNFPCFAGRYTLQTIIETAGVNKFWSYKITNNGWTPKAIYDDVKTRYEALKGVKTQVDLEEAGSPPETEM